MQGRSLQALGPAHGTAWRSRVCVGRQPAAPRVCAAHVDEVAPPQRVLDVGAGHAQQQGDPAAAPQRHQQRARHQHDQPQLLQQARAPQRQQQQRHAGPGEAGVPAAGLAPHGPARQQQPEQPEQAQGAEQPPRQPADPSAADARGPPPASSLTPRVQRRCRELLAEGRCGEADALAWSAVMRVGSLDHLQAAAAGLDADRLLRPAVVVALVVQLGKLTARAQRPAQLQAEAEARAARTAAAVEANRDRQLRRQQHRREAELQQEQEQQAAAESAREATRRALMRSYGASAGMAAAAAVAASAGSGAAGHRQQHQHHQQQPAGGQPGAAEPPQPSKRARRLAFVNAKVKAAKEARRARQALAAAPAGGAAAVASETAASEAAAAGGGSAEGAAAVAQPAPRQKQLQQQQPASLRLQPRQQLLLRRLLDQLGACDATSLTPTQLGLLSHWLAKLGGADPQLLQQVQAAAAQQLPAVPPQALVPLVWGVAKAAAAAADSAAAAPGGAAGARRGTPAGSDAAQSLAPAGAGGPVRAAGSAQQQQQQQPPPQRPLHDERFVSSWLEASTPHLATFEPSQLASSIYSLALLGTQPPAAWADAFFAASQRALPASSAQDLSNTLWAMGSLRLAPPAGGRWWAEFQAAALAVLWDFTGVGIANLLWGAGRLGLQPQPRVAELLLWQAQRRFAGMDLQLVASMAWAVARLRLRPRLQWLHQLGRRVHALSAGLTPGLASSLLLSLGALRYCPRRWMARLLAGLAPQLPRFGPRDVAHTFTGLARMRYAPSDDWLFDFLMATRAALPACGARHLLPIAHGLAVLANSAGARVAHPDLLAALLARARAVAGELDAGEAAALATSLVYLQVAPGAALLAGLAGAAQRGLDSAGARDVARLLWALGAFWRGGDECMWLRTHPELPASLLAAAARRMGEFGPLELRRVAAAVAAMGANPGAGWLAAHEAAVAARLPQMHAGSLDAVLRSYRQLGYAPERAQELSAALAGKQAAAAEQQRQEALRRQRQAEEGAGAGWPAGTDAEEAAERERDAGALVERLLAAG